MLRLVEVTSIARLELGEVRRSRWIAFAAALYLVLAGIFVLVGVRESAVMGFTGMGRVLLAFSNALVLALPLLGLVATGQAVNRARDDGTLELLFSHPVSRGGYFLAISLVRYMALALPLLVLLPALGLVGELLFRQSVPWAYIGRVAAVSSSLLFAAVAAGLCVSTYVRNPAKALMILLLVFALATTLVDFALVSLMLTWRLKPEVVFALAAVNPVEAARMALLASADPELSTLGPVGFYLANRVGPDALVALGIVWPAVVGLTTFGVALRRFRRGDLV